MLNCYYHIFNLLQSNFFECSEDAIDYIQDFYKSGRLTLEERNKLLNLVN